MAAEPATIRGRDAATSGRARGGPRRQALSQSRDNGAAPTSDGAADGSKEYYVHENMQLRAAVQKYQALMNQTLLPLLRTVQPLVLDDAFVRGEIRRAKRLLDALDLRLRASLPSRQLHGWSCVTHTQSDAVAYDIQKRFQHVSLDVISNHIWHVYQDSAAYVQLGDLLLDHEVLRTIGDNVLVLRISTWLTSLQQAIPMYLVLYREVSSTSYTLYVATLRPDLTPSAHTFAFLGVASPDGYVSSCKGAYSLIAGSVVDADSILEQMIFSHCRFEALLKSSFKDLRLCDR
ncbi:hypothetical protein SPRG_08766 [Saprolegnia parasitica CBS 223.65]|uniref:START domain-containing protein n=1 Tax=Saprolegnia parasitica (strain CBS 223.65) TaxID=695850 RepID=A0A067C5N7_SAPPC|nr:hypothetical protein SPRG_08766 [Saprolegnia parasitica CBS 223.65]KDO25823.1 hypothetical protein SPRG_08766 [Saprolegnia parasitica CBS 223.65]|eukprot:XP_012203388.1 hypothetical protein SPRG_08766 [Saprolegnia parasitica CBS 223.65]